MFEPTLLQYVKWFRKRVRHQALDGACERLRANYVKDPSDPLHRPAYHRLIKAGVPESAIPAVLDLMILTADNAAYEALAAVEHLRRTDHLKLEVRAGDGDTWKRVVGDELEFILHYADEPEFGQFPTTDELKRLIDHDRSYEEPTCPLNGCAVCGATRKAP